MMITNGGTSVEWLDDDDLVGDDGALSMDIESFLSILDEDRPDDSSQSGLVDPSLSIALFNESASNVGVNEHSQIHDDHSEASASRAVCSPNSSDCERQTVNYGLTKVEPMPNFSNLHFSWSPADLALPVPPGDTTDFSSSSHYDTRETNFKGATKGGTFGISDDNGKVNHQLMDKSGITDYANLHTTSESPFVDVSGYSDILYNPDDESSMASYIMNRKEPTLIYNHGMFLNDTIPSNEYQNSGLGQYINAKSSTTFLPSSESSTDTPARGSSINGNHFPAKLLDRRQIVSMMEGTNDMHLSLNNRSATSQDFSLPRVVPISRKDHHLLQTPSQSFLQHDTSIKKESKFAAFNSMGSIPLPPKVGHGHVPYIDVDDDICILEDLSEPPPRKQSPVDLRPPIQRSSLGVPPTHTGFNNSRIKVNDERVIYRVALQDLSQPKTEASAPEGALVVSLLRHQRIALSWMVQKETKSMHCFGGILADDQGLGKTISTIALILKERSPSSNAPTTEVKKIETETLNLDDDDDDVTDLDKTNKKINSCAIETNASSKSRPAAGTLVVCPTSVLRQWNDELHNKVSSQANLSVLVYHGANRTKDPSELAKYDVVLTTYAIVSMEVPKQPLVDEDEDETKRRNDYPHVGLSPSKKRKYPPSSSKKKDKKGILENELYESLARPLAKVRWFRVVLDEAQSIKNHRTQVARACWGLRAKRRWCLSGTPIQNAIDDLYSYFRFLRYDPYAVYKSFCSQIKGPIQRSPGTGYRKLQAVLKTIMLRRTKATLLDGEPIISLPPKTINLKKVDFTAEERDFYCRLEAESRAQFEEYAAAGTVKQNYVNILLMLLRLRQACDHPLLVRGCSSNSEWKSSLDKAKKLPPEKRSRLLNCLEASLAICSICSDPPEDAVVTTCEHVFCNQCILEHLSSDDSQCPSPKCKVILNTSSVFSKSTLRVSLSDHNPPDSSTSVKTEPLETCSSSGSVSSSNIEAAEALDSSKIKAAVDVLQNIAKPREIKCSNDIDLNAKENIVVREKAIVFSQWTRMLDLLEACLKDSSIGYRRLDGTMSVVARDKAVKDFNTLPEVTVMIMSLKAASLGLNMVAACHVLLLDLWWNPTTEDQAIDRAHRIGQTRPVSVLRLTVKDTVEDRILALQQKKREMVSSAFGEDETGSSQTRLTVDDLKYLFQA